MVFLDFVEFQGVLKSERKKLVIRVNRENSKFRFTCTRASSPSSNMNLSFSGCGFLGIYHVGVAVSMKQYAPHLLMDKISGASAGALAAVGLLCDLPLGECLVIEFRSILNLV